MSERLSISEAYNAGRQDCDTAAARTNAALRDGTIKKCDRESFFLQELLTLWQARIDHGELDAAPLPTLIEKAS